MTFKITKNKNSETYKVTNKNTGMVYSYATRNPSALISAVEINKVLHAKIKNKKK